MKYIFITNMQNKRERGVVLFITLVVLGGVLAIVLGIGALLVGQIKLVGGIGNAVTAFYAAEAGIEWAAFDSAIAVPGSSFVDVSLVNFPSASYTVTVELPGSCAGIRCIKSVGLFNSTTRAVDVEF